MSDQKTIFSVADASHAAMMCIMALSGELIRKGVINTDEGNVVFALAASMCRGGGNEQAAKIIENIVPSCIGIDPVQVAKDRGDDITMKP